MSRRLFVDTPVPAYAVGGRHEQRGPCRDLVAAAARGEVELHASVEAVQEFLFHRLRRGDRAEAVQQAVLVRDLLVLHPFDAAVADRMVELVRASTIGGRDAVHAATALQAGFDAVVSTDPAFDRVPGLRTVLPVDA